MTKVELFFLAFEEESKQRQVEEKCPEAMMYRAYLYSEKSVSLFRLNHEYSDLLDEDKLSDDVERYCLAILSGRAKPMKYEKLVRNT